MFGLFFLLACLCKSNDDDDDGFGWGLGESDDEGPKEIVWDKVPVNDVIIIGSGPAGCTAALYLARAGYKPVVLHGTVPGGQLVYTTEIENYPGFKGTGPDLVKFMEVQAKSAGAVFQAEKIIKADLSVFPYTLESENGVGYKCKSLIIATGANARYLGLESEQRLRNRGVSACAVCDGALYQNQDVAIVGGGDTAIEEALYLNKLCKSVKLIHRRDQLRASAPMKKRLAESTVEMVWDTVVDEVIGDDFVTGLRLKNVKTQKTSTISVGALFVAIGHVPATEPFKDQLPMDKEGYFTTNGTPATDKPGVYVAGDCADKVFRQAITSAGTGCQAALLAEKYLLDLAEKEQKH